MSSRILLPPSERGPSAPVPSNVDENSAGVDMMYHLDGRWRRFIAGVLWRAARPSEQRIDIGTRGFSEPSMYLPIGRAVRRTAGALFYRTGRRGSDAAERPSRWARPQDERPAERGKQGAASSQLSRRPSQNLSSTRVGKYKRNTTHRTRRKTPTKLSSEGAGDHGVRERLRVRDDAQTLRKAERL